MQSETEDFLSELEACDIQGTYPRIFELYEEYSQRSITDTIRTRRENFEKADIESKRELEKKVEREVNNFRVWLEKVKNLQSDTAYYYSTSLKSLLLGLPISLQIACFFDVILSKQARE